MTRDTRIKKFRRRLGSNSPGLTIGVIALILALTGGALAASGALTGKQKKEVEKIAKKYAGKPGSQGPAGTPGANGKDGANGANGTNGTNGKDGASVTGTPIAAGLECAAGGVKYTLSGTSTPVCNGKNGTPGTPGTNGQDAGFNYLFSTDTTATDPGTGKLKLDNADPKEATTLLISETDNNANLIDKAIAMWISSTGVKGTLMVRKSGAPGTFVEYAIKGRPVDEGSFDVFSVVSVASGGTFTDGSPITVAYSASGTPALSSGAIEYGTWSFTGTEADESGIMVPLSFPVRLGVELTEEQVHFSHDADFADFCKGSPKFPLPLPGELCVWDSAGVPLVGTEFEGIYNPNGGIGSHGAIGPLPPEGANTTGAVLLFAQPTEPAFGSGVFAVAAP